MLKSIVREGDIACRYGGEEFLVIMAEADDGGVEKRANATRQVFGTMPIGYEGSEFFATISIGIAYYPQHGENMNDVTHRGYGAVRSQAGRAELCVWKGK